MDYLKNYFIITLLFAGCSPKTIVSTGPFANAGPVSISAIVDSDGAITLSGTYQQTLVGTQSLGAGWEVEFQTTLNEAKDKQNTLYILYDDNQGYVHQQEYNIQRPFEVEFTNEQWVQKIIHDGNGNIVVYVQTQKTVFQTADSNGSGNIDQPVADPCRGAPLAHLKKGGYAYVSENPPIVNRVREGPGFNYLQVGSIANGHSMKVLDDPQCADGYYWWKVQALRNLSVIGWSAEGDSSEYWLIPCESQSSCP